LDVGRDPESKRRLLNGRVNQIVCPHCGFQGGASTPLIYHDLDKELLIAHMPMELGLGQAEQEKVIGDLTNHVMNSLDPEDRKAYLLQPKMALSLQGLVDQVLEADGITKEVIEDQQRKIEFMHELAQASAEEQDQIIAENPDAFDAEFFELLNMYASAATQQGQSRESLRLLNLRSKLMEVTELGQQLKAREQAMQEASQELQALGERITREDFVGLIVESAGNPEKVEALGVLAGALLDYTTFQMVTDRANAAEGEEQDQIIAAREKLLQISAAMEQAQRAAVEQSAQTLLAIMSAPDVGTAVRENLDQIDNTFMSVLQANLEEAQKTGNIEASGKLRAIRDEVLALIQASAPPEVQLIKDLLSVEDEAASLEMLRERQGEVNADLVALMGELVGQLRQSGNEAAAVRLEILGAEAAKLA
jgi:hypothetical protein